MPRTVIFYTVAHDDAPGGSIACETLKEAMQLRAGAGPGFGRVARLHAQADSLRSLVVNIYNREGFAAKRVDIAPDNPVKRDGDE